MKPDRSADGDPGRPDLDANRQSFTGVELAQLRDLLHKPEKPWYRNYAFLVSVLAFLLSLSTSAIATYTSYRKDINDQLAQLAAAIQNIQDLNLKQVELYEKYKDSIYGQQAGGLITSQVNNTLQRASDLAFQLKSHASTAASHTIAQGLYGSGDSVSAQKLLEFALQATRTANDESIVLRSLGFMKIRTASPKAVQEGEEFFFRALNLDRKYPDLSLLPHALIWLKASAHFGRAAAYAPYNCPEAQKSFREGLSILESPLRSLDLDQMRSQAQAQAKNGIGDVPQCKL